MIMPGREEAYFQLSGLMMTSVLSVLSVLCLVSMMFFCSGSQEEKSESVVSASLCVRAVRTAGSK